MIEKNKTTVEEKKKEVVEKTQKEIGKAVEKMTGTLDKKDKESEKDKSAEDDKKTVVKKQVKKEVNVNVRNIPMSTKHSMALCDFIRKKKIGDAIKDVEEVLAMKRAVPMKGEIPHRKGKGMMSGRFPQNASGNFLDLLKSLAANAVHNGIENPIIVEAVANLGERPYGKFGRVRRKRTHILIKAQEANK